MWRYNFDEQPDKPFSRVDRIERLASEPSQEEADAEHAKGLFLQVASWFRQSRGQKEVTFSSIRSNRQQK